MKTIKALQYVMRTSVILLFLGLETSFGVAAMVIPEPEIMTPTTGEFVLSDQTVIETDENTAKLGVYMQALFAPATGFKLPVRRTGSPKQANANRIRLRLKNSMHDLGEEGYTLAIKKDEINLCC
jgi:hypothetical protein